MIVLDVNVLLAAHRDDHPHHALVQPWFEQMTAGTEPFVVPDFVWASFAHCRNAQEGVLRSDAGADAFAFVDPCASTDAHRSCSRAVTPRYVRGSLPHRRRGRRSVNDAYLAAITVELGATLVSLDREFRDSKRSIGDDRADVSPSAPMSWRPRLSRIRTRPTRRRPTS